MTVSAFVHKMRIVGKASFAMLICLVIAAGMPLLVFQYVAAWYSDPTLNMPVCTAAGDQTYPVAVDDGIGGTIVVWQDYRSGDNWDIYAQRLDSKGTPQWVVDGIGISTAASDQFSPAVVADGSGGAIIAWQDKRSSNYDIYAQRVNSSGITLWTANGVAICTAAYDQVSPVLLSDGSGGAIIAWQDKRNCNYDIYAQRINSSGIPQWTANGIAVCVASYDQTSAVVVGDGSGGVIIAWQDNRNCNYDIYAQRINSSGIPQWTANGIAVCTTTGHQVNPVMVNDGSGGTIIVWQDYRSGTNYDIYGQRIGPSGTAHWTTNGIAICTAAEGQLSPAAASDGSGGAIITWQDRRTGINDNIYAQRVNSMGILQWDLNGTPICTAAEDQVSPIALSDGLGGAIIAWRDARSSTSYDVYSQRISQGGMPHWDINGVAICTARDDQSSISGTSDGSGGAIIVWQDSRNMTTDIYAQRVYSSGALSRPPNQPSNISPPDGATDVPLTPTLQCTAFSGAEPGDFHVASQWRITRTSGDYTSPVFDSGRDSFSLRQIVIEAGKLNGNTTYYWQVRHQNNFGLWSPWSAETSFTTRNRPPNRPTGISPQDGAYNVELTPILQSSAFYDPDAGDIHAASQWRVTTVPGDYSSPVYLSPELTLPLTQMTIPSGLLTGNTTYYWQVRHKDNHGDWSAWSEEKNFTTLNRAPDQPTVVSPPAGAGEICLSPALQSSVFSDPDAGDTHEASQWQITTKSGDYSNPIFDNVRLEATNLTSIVIPPHVLKPDTVYFWRVRYQDNHGAWSEWSAEADFATQGIPVENPQERPNNPPHQPVLLEPLNGATDISLSPTLKSSLFYDPDAGDSHKLSQWQITAASGNFDNPVFEQAKDAGTSITIPAGVLDYNTTYYWRVRYQDNRGAWSEWSMEFSFTTEGEAEGTYPVKSNNTASLIYIALVAAAAVIATAVVAWQNNRALRVPAG